VTIKNIKRYQIVSWSLYLLGAGLLISGVIATFLFADKIQHPFALSAAGFLVVLGSNVAYRAGRSGSTLRFWRFDNPYFWLCSLLVLAALVLFIRVIVS
jgi:hypothetical protein